MKTILITGGSDGLGKALAASLVKKYNVVILAHDDVATKAAAAEIGVDFVVANVTNYSSVEKTVGAVVAKYGAIDVLVNNAGVWIQGLLETNDPARIADVLAVNTLGTINGTRAIIRAMKSARHGRIVNVISQAGLNVKAERSVYTASKWAITGFTKSLAVELEGSGVTVTGFYPGPMKTNLFAKAGDNKDMTEYMDVAEAVRALTFIIDTPETIAVPELGVKPAGY